MTRRLPRIVAMAPAIGLAIVIAAPRWASAAGLSTQTAGAVASVSPPSVDFGNVTTGTMSGTTTVFVSNNGSAELDISAVSLSGTNATEFATTNDGCTGAAVAVGNSCSFDVEFAPNADGPSSAMASIADNAADTPQTVPLTGTGVAPAPAASVDPTSIDFGTVATGTSSTATTVTVSNIGTAPLDVSTVALSGTNAGEFSITADGCSDTGVAVNSTCTFGVVFSPTATGPASATVSVTDNASDSPQQVSLTGNAVPPGPPAAQLSATSLTFTNQTPGTYSSAQTVTVTNTGGSALTVQTVALTGTDPSQFIITNDSCTGQSVGLAVSCQFDVTFHPTVVGTPAATITITDNAPDSPQSVTLSAVAQAGLVVHDLNHGPSAADLASSLVGGGVTISNVTYTGAPNAAGSFSGGADIIGFDSGIALSSGSVQTTGSDVCSKGIEGPNQCDSNTTANGTPGDSDLTTLSGHPTFDASILEFDFVPSFSTVQFKYVFGSDEYNEFVNSQFNDVFGFFVNGVNCATVPGTGQPVSINTINGGNPFGTSATNPSLYRNNSRNDPGPATIDTEMDGLTVVLTCNATVNPGVTNHMKLAIADASDDVLDSNALIEGGSLISGTQVATNLHAGDQSGASLTVPSATAVSDSATLSGAASSSASGTLSYTVFSDSNCSTVFASGGTKTVTDGIVPDSDPVTFPSAGTFFWQASYSGDALNNASTSACGSEMVTVTGTPPSTTTTSTTVPGSTTTTSSTTVPPTTSTTTTSTTTTSTTTTSTTTTSTTTTMLPPTTTTVPPTTTTTTTVAPPTTTTTVGTTTTQASLPPPTTATTAATLLPSSATISGNPSTATISGIPASQTITGGIIAAHAAAGTTTTAASTTTTTTAPPTTTTVSPGPPAPAPSAPAGANASSSSNLHLDSPSGIPGGEVIASGSGCAPGSEVQISIEGQPAGSTMADAQGSFSTRIAVPNLAIGPHDVVSECGDVTLRRPFLIVLSTAASSAPSSVLAAAFAFFVLLGLLFLMLRPKPPIRPIE